ncbi:MAG: insulinase family protein [Bacteroidetes bacterium]|nr:insulinase family protein [Bacteroidota bacterium]
MLNRKVQPEIVDAINFDLKLKPYEYFTLKNGIPVYALRAPEQEVALIEWVFYAGNVYEKEDLTARTANFLLKNGTKKRSALAINEHFEYYGAFLNRSCHGQISMVRLHCLSKHLKELLPVVNELLTESIFPEEELSIFQQNRKQSLEVSLKKCDFVANRLIEQYLFGSTHPCGKHSTFIAYDNLKRDNLIRFYEEYYLNGRCLMFISGNLPDDIEILLNNNFGSLQCNKPDADAIVFEKHPDETKIHSVIIDENDVQGAIRLARPFPNMHHPDNRKAKILNVILGGYFGSRLMSNIREDKGYTYGIHSSILNYNLDSAWMISTEAGKDVCSATIEEIFKEMKRMCDEPVGEAELHLVKNFIMGTSLANLDGPFQIISRWRQIILNNLTEESFYQNILTIKNITADELQDLANKYLQPDAFYQLVVI